MFKFLICVIFKK